MERAYRRRAEALPKLEERAESDGRLIGPEGTISPRTLAKAVGIRAEQGAGVD